MTLGACRPFPFEPCQFFNQRGVIGPEIAEEIFDIELIEGLQKVVGGRVRCGVSQ